ncbi:laccase-3-like [Carex rostrata]
MNLLLFTLLSLCLSLLFTCTHAEVHYHEFVIEATPVKRLCKTHMRITVNGMFPGPTLEARNGDTMIIKAINRSPYNSTLHWHGIRQLRTAWADGPEFVTQCPIRPGETYTYRFTIEGQEGTLWWHAHSSWLRATVHGALIIYPKLGSSYPFPKPHREFPVLIGEWWNRDPISVLRQAQITGGAPNVSNAYTINGQPGDLYKCSSQETTVFPVSPGETVLLRVINAAMNNEHFLSVAGHTMTVVAADAAYTKPFTTPFLLLGPGQTTDVLISAPEPYPIGSRFYIAAHVYSAAPNVPFDNTTTTAIIEYSHPTAAASTLGTTANVAASNEAVAPATDVKIEASTTATTVTAATTNPPIPSTTDSTSTTSTENLTSNTQSNNCVVPNNGNNNNNGKGGNHNPLPPPLLPPLPAFNDSRAAAFFTGGIKNPGPVELPGPVTERLFFTVGLGTYFCPPSISCGGPNNTRFAASMNNVSFVLPKTFSLLQAHLFNIPGVFTTDFPPFPPKQFDYTGNNISPSLVSPVKGTKLFRLKFGSVVDLVLQGTNIFAGEEHPMHLHGHQFYVLATGSGNFNPSRDASRFNLVDPPQRNTIGVPVLGWAVIRFVANNPGVWLMHCHIDSHLQWGLAMAFITENGFGELETIEPPPADLPIC